MIDAAFSAFINRLKTEFTEVQQILLNWPGPNLKVKFPYMVVLIVSQKPEMFTPRHLKSTKDDSTDPPTYRNVYVTGQWETRIDVHYLAKRGKRSDQTALIQKFTDFMQADFIAERSISPTLVLPFGTESYQKANIQILDWQLDQISANIQVGERRSIFELIMDIPRLVETAVPTIDVSRIDIDAEISENVDTSRME